MIDAENFRTVAAAKQRPLQNVQFCSSSRKAIRLRQINRRNILNISRIKI